MIILLTKKKLLKIPMYLLFKKKNSDNFNLAQLFVPVIIIATMINAHGIKDAYFFLT